jgi:monofunctional biosynthetic peptidoglycan transglycosylase
MFCSVLLIGATFFVFMMFYANDVEKLVQNYPYFDKKTKSYQFTSVRPKWWISIDSVAKEVKWAIIVSEDWAFFEHEGLDVEQIKIAATESFKQEKFVRGASTITQQVIKNTILTSKKSLWRKFQEAILSYKVEQFLSKDKILEIYLNIIELGEDLYGIGPASFHYFGKHPSQLTAREGAFLAMLLPSPKKYSVSFKNKELTPFARGIVESILIKMRQAQVYSNLDWLKSRKQFYSWEMISPEYRNSIYDVEKKYREENKLLSTSAENKKENSIKESSDEEYLEYNVYE